MVESYDADKHEMKVVTKIGSFERSGRGDSANIRIALSVAPDCAPIIVISINDTVQIDMRPNDAREFGEDIIKACADAEKVTEKSQATKGEE